MRKTTVLVAALVAVASLLAGAGAAEARRDTNWPCEGCVHVGR